MLVGPTVPHRLGVRLPAVGLGCTCAHHGWQNGLAEAGGRDHALFLRGGIQQSGPRSSAVLAMVLMCIAFALRAINWFGNALSRTIASSAVAAMAANEAAGAGPTVFGVTACGAGVWANRPSHHLASA